MRKVASDTQLDIDTHTHSRTLAITNGKLVCKQSEKGNWQMKPNLGKHRHTHTHTQAHMKRFPQATGQAAHTV